MNYYFVRVYTDATTNHIREVSIDGMTRGEPIDPENIGYVEYVRDILGGDASKVEKVAGNKYVTIGTDGTVAYDSIMAAADAKAVQWAQVRAQRDNLLADTDYILMRHEDQQTLIAAGKLAATTRTDAEILDVKVYRQALRDITTQSDPYRITWPEIPE